MKPTKNVAKRPDQKYIINPSQTIKSLRKMAEGARSFDKRRQTVNNSAL